MTRNYAAILHRSLPRGSVAFRKSTIKEELTSGIVAVVRYNTTIDPDTVPEGEPAPMATTVTVVEKSNQNSTVASWSAPTAGSPKRFLTLRWSASPS